MKTNKSKPACTGSKQDCAKYGIAITNYILDENIGMSEDDLFHHLAECPNCRQELKNWRATHALLRAQEYDSRPEVKAKNAAFIKELANRPMPCVFTKDEVVHDSITETGNLAGDIWEFVAKNGKTSDIVLAEQLKRPIKDINNGIGWLEREAKIVKSSLKDVRFICLTSIESAIHSKKNQPKKPGNSGSDTGTGHQLFNDTGLK